MFTAEFCSLSLSLCSVFCFKFLFREQTSDYVGSVCYTLDLTILCLFPHKHWEICHQGEQSWWDESLERRRPELAVCWDGDGWGVGEAAPAPRVACGGLGTLWGVCSRHSLPLSLSSVPRTPCYRARSYCPCAQMMTLGYQILTKRKTFKNPNFSMSFIFTCF